MATLKFQVEQIITQQNKELDFMFKQSKKYGDLKKEIINKTLMLQKLDYILTADIDLLKLQIKQMITNFYKELEIELVKFGFETYVRGYIDIIEIGMFDIDGKVSRKELNDIINSDKFKNDMRDKYNNEKNKGLTKKTTFKDTLLKRENDFKKKISLLLESFKGDINA